MKLYGATLKWVDKVKHLGNHLQYNLCEAREVTMKKNDLIQRVNQPPRYTQTVLTSSCLRFSLLNVPISMEPKPLMTFKQHGIAVLGGSQLIPYETHKRYFPNLVGISSAKHQIYTRFVKLVSKMENSGNARVGFLTRQCRNLSRSIIGGESQDHREYTGSRYVYC